MAMVWVRTVSGSVLSRGGALEGRTTGRPACVGVR